MNHALKREDGPVILDGDWTTQNSQWPSSCTAGDVVQRPDVFAGAVGPADARCRDVAEFARAVRGQVRVAAAPAG